MNFFSEAEAGRIASMLVADVWRGALHARYACGRANPRIAFHRHPRTLRPFYTVRANSFELVIAADVSLTEAYFVEVTAAFLTGQPK